jgi:hypothetical protein
VFASPDIMVRPRSGPSTTAPAWQFGASGAMKSTSFVPYQLWTFQTAFRWIFPAVEADGTWPLPLDDLIRKHRLALGLTVLPQINKALWDAVVGGTHLDATGAVTSTVTDPLAVYREPWHYRTALTAPGNEADLLRRVHYPSVTGNVATVFMENNTVDVLIHHRDTRPVPANQSFAILVYRSDRSRSALLGLDLSAFPAWVRSVLAADVAATPTPHAPGGWTVALAPSGQALNRLSVALDARMPRSVSFDVDLSAVHNLDHVLFLAFTGSDVDQFAATPYHLPATPTVSDLVTRWLHAAARLVRVITRP